MKKLPKITHEEWLLCNDFNRSIRDEFIENSTDLSPNTKKVYHSNLQIWFNWVRNYCNNKKHTDCRSIDLMKFQNWLINKGHSPSDIYNKRAAISSLNNYLLVYYEDEYPSFRNFVNKGVKLPEKSYVNEKIPPTKAEMEMLYNEMEKQEKWQHLAYLKFTFATGCRRAETRLLRKDFINTPITIKMKKVKDNNGIEIEQKSKYYLTHKIRCKGKGATGKVRQFKVSVEAMEALKKWIEIRGEDDCEYMFVTNYGGCIKQASLNIFNQWSTRIFTPILGRRFHPHILREAKATTSVVEDGKSLESVQKLIGHNSSETTKIYVIKNDEDDESDDLFVD